MKPRFECLKCILTVRLREIENTSVQSELKIQVARELLRLLIEDFSLNAELTRLATSAFKLVVSRLPDIIEYYKKIKYESTLIALQDLKRHEEHVAKYTDRYEKFKYLVKLSGLANMIDYGVAEHAVSVKSIDPVSVEKTELFIDHTHTFYEILRKGHLRVLWLFDNAGEAVYDTLLIKEIKSMGNTVLGAVKEEPGFQNDITLQDAVFSGLTSILDGVLTYRGSTIHIDNLSEEMLAAINRCDLVIAKGMSHYEYLVENSIGKPVVFILVPKCDPVASTLGLNSRGKVVCTLCGGGI